MKDGEYLTCSHPGCSYTTSNVTSARRDNHNRAMRSHVKNQHNETCNPSRSTAENSPGRKENKRKDRGDAPDKTHSSSGHDSKKRKQGATDQIPCPYCLVVTNGPNPEHLNQHDMSSAQTGLICVKCGNSCFHREEELTKLALHREKECPVKSDHTLADGFEWRQRPGYSAGDRYGYMVPTRSSSFAVTRRSPTDPSPGIFVDPQSTVYNSNY